MDGQRQRSGGGRRRRRRARNEPRPVAEPVLIAARRPDSPLLKTKKTRGRSVAASASPSSRRGSRAEAESRDAVPLEPVVAPIGPQRRAARIVRPASETLDERELQKRRLLDRLMTADGRGAVSRAADDYIGAGFELPDDQAVHLQLLEHFDEDRVRDALDAMCRILSGEPPIKRPVLDQRLRRIEEHADELRTRSLAAELRRSLRG